MSTQLPSAPGPRSLGAYIFNTLGSIPHASDLTERTPLLRGQHVLDLACGAGHIANPAAAAVGPTASVLSADISAELLDRARREAGYQGLNNVAYIQYDVRELLGSPGLRKEGYDVITCASAVPLLDDLEQTMKQWAALLKPGARMLIRVPTEKAQIPQLVFQTVAARGSLETLVRKAGLEVEKSHSVRNMQDERVWEGSDVGRVFDEWVDGQTGAAIGELEEDCEKRALVRGMFEEEFVTKAGWDGVVREEDAFYYIVGRKAQGVWGLFKETRLPEWLKWKYEEDMRMARSA